MDTLTEYFTAKHSALDTEYKDNCLTIARDIAKLLLDQGQEPYILMLEIVEQRGENRFHGPLMPVRYSGAATFTKHYVCYCDGLAYDPINPEPVAIDRYTNTIFGMEIPMKIFVSTSEVRNYLASPARIIARI